MQISKKKGAKRKYEEKPRPCPYCKRKEGKLTYFKRLDKHVLSQHKEHEDVAPLQEIKDKKERRKIFDFIGGKADTMHNSDQIKRNESNFILKRRTPVAATNEYLPCMHCGKMIAAHTLWHHIKIAHPEKTIEGKRRKVQEEASRHMEKIFHKEEDEIDPRFILLIIYQMSKDVITEAVKKDLLILKVGERLFHRYGSDQKKYIRQYMRLLGRILISLRIELKNPKLTLNDSIRPKNFKSFVEVAKKLAMGSETDTGIVTYGKYSNALKVGIYLKKAASVKQSLIIENETNDVHLQHAENFLTLIKNDWTDYISGAALTTRNVKKAFKSPILPLTEDITKVVIYVEERIKHYIFALNDAFEMKDAKKKWLILARYALSKLMLLNRRRSGDLSKMELTHYNNPIIVESNERTDTFSEIEMWFLLNSKLVKVRGKRSRIVDVIILPEMAATIDVLIANREKAGICSENKYVFARAYDDSVERLDSSEALRLVVQQVNKKTPLRRPEAIVGTDLRKHVATIVQLANLTETELDGLARFLGHDIRVHRQFYRLSEDAFTLSKISKLLVALERGQIDKIKDKSLDQIELTGKYLFFFLCRI